MKKRLFFFVLLLTTFINKPTGAQTFPESLRIDYQVNPLGTDNPSPDFSWTINSAKRGSFQTAYEIWLSPNEENLKTGKNLIWQTGKINGNQSFGIKYTEKPLLSFTRYHWRIRIWDEKGIPSNWSSTFWFETAMMNPSDWKASWISNQRTLPLKDEDFYKEIPNPLLRKAVSIKKEVMSARLYIAGLGYYVAYINGQRVGDHMLDPGWTQYDKEILYSTYDVTRMLPKGANVLGIMLGNGWYNPLPIRLFQSLNLREHLTIGKPCLKAQLYIKYRDGSTETIVTNNSWKAGDGPVLKNSIYTGEMYDARKEQTGWNTSAFDDSRWEKAMIVPGPKGQLMTQKDN